MAISLISSSHCLFLLQQPFIFLLQDPPLSSSSDNPIYSSSNIKKLCRKAVTTAPHSPPLAHLSAAIAPVQMDHLLVVAPPVSAIHGHHYPRTPDTPSTSTIDALGSRQAKKNTQGPCHQLKTAKITRVTNRRITIRYEERYWAAPTAEQHSALAHDIGHVVQTNCPMQWKSGKVMPNEVRTKVHAQLSVNELQFEDINNDMLTYVALEEGCPKEFEGQEDNWTWLCNQNSRRSMPLYSSILIIILRIQVSWLGTYCRGMGNARWRDPRAPSSSQLKSQVTALTAEVADLMTELASYRSQMSLIVQALSQSGIRLPNLRPPSTFQPKHGHTFQLPPQDDHVDYATLFF
ncbi:hypothetical protein D8674_038111 [Pyrus ussuriensis x Pyrus communis]|uniref:Uncharacterized protein n=1 Tax=Pyrus ussuriensis x Pyrus communis TaxID=2448454 RepID=A0A5N5I374_9ROSA|nr:hypothetical protein D8674_038111 [Pyrus ussuriensis x Pyrus communis]